MSDQDRCRIVSDGASTAEIVAELRRSGKHVPYLEDEDRPTDYSKPL